MPCSQMNTSQMPISHYSVTPDPVEDAACVRVIIHRIAKSVHLKWSYTEGYLWSCLIPGRGPCPQCEAEGEAAMQAFLTKAFPALHPASALFPPAVLSLPWIRLSTCATKPSPASQKAKKNKKKIKRKKKKNKNGPVNNLTSVNTVPYAGVNGFPLGREGREQSSHILTTKTHTVQQIKPDMGSCKSNLQFLAQVTQLGNWWDRPRVDLQQNLAS